MTKALEKCTGLKKDGKGVLGTSLGSNSMARIDKRLINNVLCTLKSLDTDWNSHDITI